MTSALRTEKTLWLLSSEGTDVDSEERKDKGDALYVIPRLVVKFLYRFP